ncbi:T9SS type B sorting domain-containing protein [Psychroserpens burtonensis]|uniref:T9SS type B sorting domain-containing protein n=1 Tax=Psychroserpens burtonensis TaxID=49278 RepID=A0A5C7B5W7_9FLAO|nr:T9SS type B sorting domain-containing protein [Psychroserpens burtonensis]TXE15322.1 T9SS type B sorting domain-containing protein [Psychroserpens burtonensis]
MLKRFIFFVILLISLQNYAQGEANIWYFGDNAGLDFNSGAPLPLFDGELITNEGCATISNPLGELLFYTDGVTVWNRNHDIMLNGTDLNGNISSTNSAIIVPKPENSNIYYIFTTDEAAGPAGLQYSEVDISLDGGLGGITANKNIVMFSPITEKITAIKNEILNEYWLVTHKWQSSEFLSYRISSLGIDLVPTVSDAGSYVGGNLQETIGQIKISPDGTKLAVARDIELSEAQLFDFDITTGSVSNPLTILSYIPSTIPVYGVEFSPNSKVLYVSVAYTGVIQFNLEAGSPSGIVNSALAISSELELNYSLQLASDGKIYVAKFNEFFMDVIDSPNTVGLGCNYLFEELYLGGRKCRIGLPPFIQSFFQIGFEVDDVCFGEITQFNANISQPYDSLLWDFGDMVTSTDENPTHTYTSPGIYNVQLTVTVGTDTSSETKEVIIYEQPIANQPNDIVICDDNNDGFYAYDLTSRDIEVLNGQSNTTFDIVYFASMDDYDNNLAISNPNAYINANAYTTETIIASIRNTLNTSCESMTTFNISLFDSPTPSQNVPDLSYCDNESVGSDTDGVISFDLTENETTILNGQSNAAYSVNYYTNAAYTNEITSPENYQNTNTQETIYIRVVNNSNQDCVAETTFQINILELPTVTPITNLSQCDDDLDGFTAFNLNEVITEITANSANENVTFYETQLEAETATNTITAIENYTNQTASSDTVWARIENNEGCFRTSQVNLQVSTTQIPNTFTRDFYTCDNDLDGNNTNGITFFDFSTVTTDIEALFPAGQQLIITYYQSEQDALSESNAILDPSNYENVNSPFTQDIYIRVDSAINNDCLGLGNHITLHVEPLPINNGPIIIEQCDIANDGVESIDTSTINDQLLQGQTNVALSFTDANGVVLSSPLPNPFITGSQSINVTMTNTASQDPNGACEISTTIDIIIDAGVVAYPVNELAVCDDDNDGLFAFDTSAIDNTIRNGQTGAIITYRDENDTALPSPLPNPLVIDTQSIIAKIENPSNALCFDETVIEFIVSAQPVAYEVQDDIICDDISNDGEYEFNLTNYNSSVLNDQIQANYNIFYFTSESNANSNSNPLPDNYVSTSPSEELFVRIENTENPLCYDVTSFFIGVSYQPIANQPSQISICDDASNDGVESVDVSVQNETILNGQSNVDNSVTYHVTQLDADDNNNPLPTVFTTTENPQTIFVRVENVNNSSCFDTTFFEIIVNEQPVLDMEDQWPICEGDSVDLIADEGYDYYTWSTGETTRTITVVDEGTYTVNVSNVYGDVVCETSKTVQVAQSNIAIITNIETIDWTQSDNVISVFVSGDGDYEYSLDGINYQDSNEFTNLNIDEYTIYVRDKNGCGITTDDVYLLYYPKFFTPNSDGYHDYWQLINSEKEPRNTIFIYDRYGKLITQLSPTGIGWDGTLNGNPLPTNDYWFTLVRQNGKEYRGHFTLKR